ncbi:hypothetical protein D3C74_283050 [compost metagenome]
MNPGLPRANDVAVTFEQDNLTCFADLIFRLMQIVENSAFGKQLAFWRVQIFRLSVAKHSSRKRDYFPASIVQRENHPITETVHETGTVLPGREQSTLLHRFQFKRSFVQKLDERIPSSGCVTNLERIDGFVGKAAGFQILHRRLAVFGVLQQVMIKLGGPFMGLQQLLQLLVTR